MRLHVPEHEVVYVRFHLTAMNVINILSKQWDCRPSTAASKVLHDYMSLLYCRCDSNINILEERELNLSPLASAFFLQRGRSSHSVLSKPMNLTLDKRVHRDMMLLAQRFDMSVQNFRIAIVITYGLHHQIIR